MVLSAVGNTAGLSLVSGKLFVLITTLGNFYLPIDEFHSPQRRQPKEREIESKLVYSLGPLYLKDCSYAIGYAVGIYLNTFRIFAPNKHTKYFIVCLLLLIELLTYKWVIKLISELLRAVLVYHFERSSRHAEAYFLAAFLGLRLYFSEDDLNLFLLISYLLLACYLWKSERSQAKLPESHQQLIDRPQV